MKFSIGQKVRLRDPEMGYVVWEIFRYEYHGEGKYFLWNRDNGRAIDVKEEEILG